MHLPVPGTEAEQNWDSISHYTKGSESVEAPQKKPSSNRGKLLREGPQGKQLEAAAVAPQQQLYPGAVASLVNGRANHDNCHCLHA